jgi:hypothetical protein
MIMERAGRDKRVGLETLFHHCSPTWESRLIYNIFFPFQYYGIFWRGALHRYKHGFLGEK